MLSDSQLQQIMPALPAANRDAYLPFLNAIMPLYGIDSPPRMAAFLAQIAHESGQLKFWEEIWGPTAAQKRYEPPSDLAKRLGNTQPGDGKRYKGRGPIQITGRANYRKYGGLLGYDLENDPALAATVQVGLQVAGQYWLSNGLNELADAQDFLTITQRINGGTNGLADREKFYAVAKRVLGVGAPRPRGATRGAKAFAAAAPIGDEAPTDRLPRGYEAINELIGDAPTGGSPEPAAKKKTPPVFAKKTTGKGVAKKAAKKVAKKPVSKPVKKAATPVKKAAKKLPVKPAKKAAKKP
ncbi:MAG TPA: glycoside hydrolase family 19 protein [Blastocatellia bacterium]|nr:glycoside hydrolase family 19 protein [Blastocatellia bacterium]